MRDVHKPAFFKSIKHPKYVSLMYFLLTVRYKDEAHQSPWCMLREKLLILLIHSLLVKSPLFKKLK